MRDRGYKYRPELQKDVMQKLLKLTNQIGLSPNKTVNVFVKLGLELIERSTEQITKDFEKKLNDLLKDFEK